MKPRESFAEHLKTQGEIQPLQESLFSNGYAIAQNAQHNSASQKTTPLTSKVATIARDTKQHDDLESKINNLCDATITMTEIIKTQIQRSTNIKIAVVASAFVQETRK